MKFYLRPCLAPRLWRLWSLAVTLLALQPMSATAQSTTAPSTTTTEIIGTDDSPLPGQTADAIIARVNGEALLLSRLKEAAFEQSIPLASLMSDGNRSEGYRRAITLLVDQTLLAQKATELGLEVDEMRVTKVVDEMISSLKQQLGGDTELGVFLDQRHLNLTDLRAMIRRRERREMLITQLISRNVRTDNQRLDNFITDRKTDGLPLEEVNLAQILVADRSGNRDSDAGKERYMQAIFVARQAGKNPDEFAQLAAKYSDEPMARETGGLIGWVDPAKLRPTLTERIKTMNTGEISEPIQTDLGYHILLLLGRRTTRDLLYAEEYMKERQRLIRQLRTDASIQLFDLDGQPLGRLSFDETEQTTPTVPTAQ